MAGQDEWRCSRCGKLLAVRRGGRLHIRIARGHEYLVSPPVTGTCRGCGTLNEFLAGEPAEA
jgi:ribosomal protein S27E